MPLDPRPHPTDTGQSVCGLADHVVSMLFHVRTHVLHRLPLLPRLRVRVPRSSYRLLRGGLTLNRPQRGGRRGWWWVGFEEGGERSERARGDVRARDCTGIEK